MKESRRCYNRPVRRSRQRALVITAVPQASASSGTSGKLSSREGLSNTEAAEYRHESSSVFSVRSMPPTFSGNVRICFSERPTISTVQSFAIFASLKKSSGCFRSSHTEATPKIIGLSQEILYFFSTFVHSFELRGLKTSIFTPLLMITVLYLRKNDLRISAASHSDGAIRVISSRRVKALS